MIVIREILRRWSRGEGLRSIANTTGPDRKTVRRYVEAGQAHGLVLGGPEPDDALIDAVVLALRPGAPSAVGEMRQVCRSNQEQIAAWVGEGCPTPKVARLLRAHTGVTVPERTLSRFIAEEIEPPESTVRLVEPPCGEAVEVDFMEVGVVQLGGNPVKVHALLVIAAYSRHLFVWPCLHQRLSDVIDGLEAAWCAFGGVFPVVTPDNPKTIVARADAVAPSLHEDFAEYSQARGFVVDLARVRHPRDKPRVERTVQYVRGNGFAGERWVDLDDMRRHIARWCRDVAGQRIHGTSRRRPLEAFEDERPKRLPAPTAPYDPPTWVDLKVGRGQEVVVAGSIYSVPPSFLGRTLRVRYDRTLVKLHADGVVVKVHPRVERGQTRLDPADYPNRGELVTRDAAGLATRAATAGDAVGTYATRLVAGAQFWQQARHVHRLLGLCARYGNASVNAACAEALAVDVVDVVRIERMLVRATPPAAPTPPRRSGSTRFSREPAEFRVEVPRAD